MSEFRIHKKKFCCIKEDVSKLVVVSNFLFKDETTTNNDIKYKEKCRLGKKSESQMGFELTTLRDLVGALKTELLETMKTGNNH